MELALATDLEATTLKPKECFDNMYLAASKDERKRLVKLAFAGRQDVESLQHSALVDEFQWLVGKYNLPGGNSIHKCYEGRHTWAPAS